MAKPVDKTKRVVLKKTHSIDKDALDFSVYFDSLNNEILIKKPDRDIHLPPRDNLFGGIQNFEPVELLIEEAMLHNIDWMPILRLQSLLKPIEENVNAKNLYALDPLERFYSIERIRKNGERDNIESVRAPNEMFDKPFVLSDSVMLSKMIERAQEESNMPAITSIPGEPIQLSLSKFYEVLDTKSKGLTERVFSTPDTSLIETNKNNLSTLHLSESDIIDVGQLPTHVEFVNSLQSQRPSVEEDANNKSRLKKSRIRSKISAFVREVKFREEIPQFEALRNNMAFKYPFELDPFQKEAILLLEQQQNVLVSAHTSAGKTVVAEYAIAMSLKHGMKTIYTSPIKALSNQKYKDFKKCFDSVGIITGDIQLNPNASCVIMTTEILRAMLYHGGSSSLNDIEWVVFDEVHYINDEQRGVVWEELLIMLPREIKLVLLSATFPNCYDFANWIGSTRQQVIHVIMTTKRPVPLEHYVYTATNRMDLNNNIFLISDNDARFDKKGICRAIESIENKSAHTKVGNLPRFKNITPNKRDGVKCLVEYLVANDKIPAIFFMFSKDACMYFAKLASSQDLTTKNEKSQIISFFNSCINRLSSENLDLPQIQDVKHCLERGIAVHHSGILPILREIVEILFQRSLIKVLFATETFSIGVNVPARTVVFLTLNKPSDSGWRDLFSSEYIQMAGRAGRRGKDEFGTVIIISSDKTELDSIEGIINGEPFVVKSQFCLTYGLILRMLSKTSGNIVNVEDLMRSSFSEFTGEPKDNTAETFLDKIVLLENEIGLLENEFVSCSFCGSYLNTFYTFCKELSNFQSEALGMLLCTPSTTKHILKTGRLCVVKLSKSEFSIGIISEEYENAKFLNNNAQGRSIPMMIFIGDSQAHKPLPVSSKISVPIENSGFPFYGIFRKISEKKHRVYHLKVHYSNIVMVCDEIIKINWKKILRESHIMSNKETAHAKSHIILDLLNALTKIANENTLITQLKSLDMSKYANDFENSYVITKYMTLLQEFNQVWSICDLFKCENFYTHYNILGLLDEKKNEIDELKFKLSDESLQLLPEYNSRINILCELGFIDSKKNLLLKGRLSNKFRNNFEILLTELLLSMELRELEPANVAAVLSCFVQEFSSSKQKPLPKFTEDLDKMWNIVLDLNERISLVERKYGLEFNKRYISPDLITPIYHWSKGASFCEVVTKFKIAEGNLVRHILRLDEICSEMEMASLYAGNPELNELIKKTRESIHKDIIFTPSLYLT